MQFRFQIRGSSMEPTLRPGDRVIALPWWHYQPGWIVVICSEDGPMVKRIAKVSERGLWVLGDNRERSTDSRELGWIPLRNVRGRVVYRYFPPDRVGWLWST